MESSIGAIFKIPNPLFMKTTSKLKSTHKSDFCINSKTRPKPPEQEILELSLCTGFL